MLLSTAVFLPILAVFLKLETIGSLEVADDAMYDEYKEYVLLVSDVQEHYKASSVIIVYAGDDESIHTTTLMMRLTREFSSKFVLSLSLNYTDLTQHYDHYRTRIVRPLFVVFLNSASEVRMFQKASQRFEISYPFWLVIFAKPTLRTCYEPTENYFNVAFDTEMMVKCYGDPILREWYSLKEDSITVHDLAHWDLLGRLQPKTTKSLYERRHTLAGKNLRIATVKDSPFIAAQQGPLSGLFATILEELSSTLNFSMSIAYKEDSYGIYNESTGVWTGVIGRLDRKDVDLGVAEFTMTAQRLDSVDFTQPIMLSRNHLYMRQPDGSALQWSAYFKVYTIDSWIALQGMSTLTWLVITYMRALIREKPIPPNHFSENYLSIWGIYCQQGLPEFPSASPMRIAYFTILVTAVILLAVYSACLISYLTVTSPSLPFSNLHEFAKDGTYKLIAFQQSADYDLFATSKDLVLKRMMKQMLNREYLPQTMMAGFRKACENKIAFYATEAVKTQISARIPCDLVYLESGRIDSLGMTLTKRSQYTGVINYHLQKFKDVGIMNRLRSRVYMKVTPSDNKYNPVNVRGIVTILLILGIGVVVSIIILIAEILIQRVHKGKENQKLMSTCKNQIVVTKNALITTFVLLFSIGNRALQIDPEDYVPFLSDVQEYYKSSGILFLYDDDSDYFQTLSNLGIFFKLLSDRGILSQAIRFSKIREKYDLSRNVQNLFVVFVTSRSNFDNFCLATWDHDMSYHTWLVIFADSVEAEVNEMCLNPSGNPFHLVFNSRMIVRCHNEDWIRKWYSLQENQTEVLDLAKWNRKLGISYKNKNYYESRYDLMGKTIRIATHTFMTSSTNGKMSGFLEDILQELENFMNFTVARVREEDAFGKWDKEAHRWTGLIGSLTNREVDLVVAPITINKFRLRFIDFTMPLLLSKNRIYIKQPDGARVQWSAYFKAFSISSWSFIALVLIAASLMTALIRLIVHETKVLQLSLNYLLENFIRVWGIYCQQGIPEFPSSTSLRLAYFTMLLLTLIIWAIYSASITSYLTFLSPSLPFSDTEGFVRDGSYKLIVLQNSSDQDIILSGLDPILATFQPLLKDLDELPKNPHSGFLQVCDERVGFYASEAVLKGVSGYIPCTLTYIETGQFECLALALRKRSPYITLRKLEDNGVVKKLNNWYFRKVDNAVESTHSPIGIWGVAPLLTIFATGLAMSSLVLLLECLNTNL
ncbi:hypothetical protein TSAR_008341 [Trichomalopsis sarcophagae]|uniref:Ionotropic glutamate receptor L-glutamate and glycine-binding domain-containing protein n=1 Tax=Trichomalopsis sarcophagae TaxID=543379 RepID=A0A232FCM4_9HYME|nr:hypothetical protein TSAR_008341 [Trichomalopsis sarcophagae]